MHDVLAHAVSLMIVQAEAGPVVMRTKPERAERAFDAIATAGRDAMVQLRRTLGVLKDETSTGIRTPQPTVDGIPGLIAQVEETGLPVELRVTGQARPLPPDAEVAAFRIVQESLTNTLKHAAATRVSVGLDWKDDTLVITVRDDGQGGAAPGLAASGSGSGLIGIRERAAACGGSAETGPAAGGGFEVHARLPVSAISDSAVRR
jgi:signal transduction histidine kinase